MATILVIFPKLYQPEKSQPKQGRLFFSSMAAVGLFLEGAQCCTAASFNSTHVDPALLSPVVKVRGARGGSAPPCFDLGPPDRI